MPESIAGGISQVARFGDTLNLDFCNAKNMLET
jgi:hypothetical protein